MSQQGVISTRRKRVLSSTTTTIDKAEGSTRAARGTRAAKDLPPAIIDVPPRKRARKVKLPGLTELPLDILLEILPKCHPRILLLLARTTKAFRALLMSKASKSIWQASLRTVVPALPQCPASMTEPQYVNLIFDRHCHNCLAPNTQKVNFELGVRYCRNCYRICLVRMPCWIPEDFYVVLSWCRWMSNSRVLYTNKPEYEAVVAQSETLPGIKWRMFVDLKDEEILDRYKHAKALVKWCLDEKEARGAASGPRD